MTDSSPSALDRIRALFGRSTPAGLRPNVSAQQALALVGDGASLVDVREPHEWRAGHAPQAVHVPLGQLDRGARRLRRDRPVLVVCASGSRSRAGAGSSGPSGSKPRASPAAWPPGSAPGAPSGDKCG